MFLAGAAAGLLLAPVLGAPGAHGTVEIVAVDVGQGDAFAIRSPAGRWLLVDAGPRSPTFDAGERRVLPFLRRSGADRLEALILTHPDLDHIGGAPAVLRGLEVGGVLDPGRATDKGPFEDVLTTARERAVAWFPAGSYPRLELDGMELRVLFPDAPPRAAGRAGSDTGSDGDIGGGVGAGTDADTDTDTGAGRHAGTDAGIDGSTGAGIDGGTDALADAFADPFADANDFSVVILLRFGRFRALLTGDAPAAVEEEILDSIDGPVQLLKVGHHGSLTSTSRVLLETLRPEAAIVSVGWRNRYGHPHPEILERLEAAGTRVYRTDLQGTVVFRAREDGSWTASLPDR